MEVILMAKLLPCSKLEKEFQEVIKTAFCGKKKKGAEIKCVNILKIFSFTVLLVKKSPKPYMAASFPFLVYPDA